MAIYFGHCKVCGTQGNIYNPSNICINCTRLANITIEIVNRNIKVDNALKRLGLKKCAVCEEYYDHVKEIEIVDDTTHKTTVEACVSCENRLAHQG